MGANQFVVQGCNDIFLAQAGRSVVHHRIITSSTLYSGSYATTFFKEILYEFKLIDRL